VGVRARPDRGFGAGAAGRIGATVAVDPERAIVCVCHHGTRSFHAGLALERHGCREVYNLVGGVDAWARQIDPSVAIY
jgi:rhodanese-related sulfurtransferase